MRSSDKYYLICTNVPVTLCVLDTPLDELAQVCVVLFPEGVVPRVALPLQDLEGLLGNAHAGRAVDPAATTGATSRHLKRIVLKKERKKGVKG